MCASLHARTRAFSHQPKTREFPEAGLLNNETLRSAALISQEIAVRGHETRGFSNPAAVEQRSIAWVHACVVLDDDDGVVEGMFGPPRHHRLARVNARPDRQSRISARPRTGPARVCDGYGTWCPTLLPFGSNTSRDHRWRAPPMEVVQEYSGHG